MRPLETRATQPLVSIVTPSFNQARFLRQTVESVLGQSYPHIEYLVVDGGSTDGSLDVLRSYGSRFAWSSEPDGGQAAAINKGLARARGEVLAYLNSDDLLLPDAVARVVAHFAANPHCDLVYGRAHYVDEEGRTAGAYNTAEYSFERLLHDCCICQPAAFWRRRIQDRVGPFDEALNYAMDYDYWLRVDRAGGHIEHLPHFLAASRQHPSTKTATARRAIYEEIFRVCRRWAGGVSLNYYLGLWHHLCFESSRPHHWPLRLMRSHWLTMANLHHLYSHCKRPWLPRFAWGCLAKVGQGLARRAGARKPSFPSGLATQGAAPQP